jgi:hypothetical protein
MGLLEKALRESTHEPAPSGKTSLYARAIAAVSGAARKTDAEAHSISSLSFTLDDLRSLKSELSALSPTYDLYLSQWWKISSVLRFSSLALFMPSGDYLVPVARIGFPSCPPSPVASSIADRACGGREALDHGSAAALSTALGASSSLPLRASAVFIESRVAALWVYRDGALEAESSEVQAEVGTVFSSGAVRGLPIVTIDSPVSDPERVLFDAVARASKAFVFLFDLSRHYEEISASCPGASVDLLRSSFTSACKKILAGEGATVVCGTARIACALASSSSSDHELALFQFGKSLRRFLPFLSVSTFPTGRSTLIEPQSDRAFAELARFIHT